MAQAPNPSNPQPRKAADNPLAATLLGALLMQQGQKHGDRSQMEQGKQLLKIADAAQGKNPKLQSDSRIDKALKDMAKTAVAP